MNFNEKGYFLKANLLSLILNLVFFTVYYTFNYLANLGDFVFFLANLITEAFPPMLYLIGALVIFLALPTLGYKRTLVSVIPFAVCRVFYLFPYYYLLFISDGFDSIESSLYSLLSALPSILLTYGVMLLISLFMRFVALRMDKEGRSLDKQITEKGVLNFDNGCVMAIFFSSLIFFVFLFVGDIIDIISFISAIGSGFTTEELLFILFEVFFSILSFVMYHLALCGLKGLAVRWHFKEKI